MIERYDHGGTAWGITPELSAQRLGMDSQEAELAFVLIARNVHGFRFDYSKMVWRTMKQPIEIIENGKSYWVPPYLHLIDGVSGGTAI
jgi:hypothetical protein